MVSICHVKPASLQLRCLVTKTSTINRATRHESETHSTFCNPENRNPFRLDCQNTLSPQVFMPDGKDDSVKTGNVRMQSWHGVKIQVCHIPTARKATLSLGCEMQLFIKPYYDFDSSIGPLCGCVITMLSTEAANPVLKIRWLPENYVD